MEARLVLFLIFISLILGIASLSGYKNYHNDNRDLSLAGYNKNEQDKKVLAEEIAQMNAPAEVVASGEYILKLNTASLKRAHEIFTGSGECLRCHGANGAGNAKEEAPLIAGQYDWYVQDQLTQMKAGTRSNPKMMEFLQKLSPQDIKDLAEYVSKLRIEMKIQ